MIFIHKNFEILEDIYQVSSAEFDDLYYLVCNQYHNQTDIFIEIV